MTPRTLLLVRHAEAGHAPPGATDRERPLSAHGRAQASAIGDLIADGTLPEPQLAFTSIATRARETWDAAAAAAHLTIPTFAEPVLYGADRDELIALVREVSDGVRVLVVVGHAPEIPLLARHVRDARPNAAPLISWPPGCVGVVEVAGGWESFPDAAALVLTRVIP